jgi:hypothetical protein
MEARTTCPATDKLRYAREEVNLAAAVRQARTDRQRTDAIPNSGGLSATRLMIYVEREHIGSLRPSWNKKRNGLSAPFIIQRGRTDNRV